jgi:hypothetical protein
MSQIFVVRPQQFSSSANRFIITMNEEPVAAIATGTYLSRLVAAGSTKLTAKTKPSILNFGLGLAFMGEPKLDWQAEAGEIYFVHVDVGFSGGPKLRLVDPSVGQQLVDEAQEADEPSAE